MSSGKNPIYLIGAGGHARVVHECLNLVGYEILGYEDINEAQWIDAPRISETEIHNKAKAKENFALGFLGTNPNGLAHRMQVLAKLRDLGGNFPALIHPDAIVSPSAKIQEGVQIWAGAVVQANATIEIGAVVNTGAIVEHDAIIGSGAHIAPGAVVLGGASLGQLTMVGAGSIVVQNCRIPPREFIKAGTTWKTSV